MIVRDDRSRATKFIPPMNKMRRAIFSTASFTDVPELNRHYSPDRVLYSCPDCGRDHFVTVDPCPTADEAAREVAQVDG